MTDSVFTDAHVVHVDHHVVVVDKPAGLLSVPFEPGDKDTLIDRVRVWLRKRDGQNAELGAVQRLDKDTTGVLVFARTLAAKRELQQQFRKHTIERRYVALVHGTLTQARKMETRPDPRPRRWTARLVRPLPPSARTRCRATRSTRSRTSRRSKR